PPSRSAALAGRPVTIAMRRNTGPRRPSAWTASRSARAWSGSSTIGASVPSKSRASRVPPGSSRIAAIAAAPAAVAISFTLMPRSLRTSRSGARLAPSQPRVNAGVALDGRREDHAEPFAGHRIDCRHDAADAEQVGEQLGLLFQAGWVIDRRRRDRAIPVVDASDGEPGRAYVGGDRRCEIGDAGIVVDVDRRVRGDLGLRRFLLLLRRRVRLLRTADVLLLGVLV